jgi:hypothetical protein
MHFPRANLESNIKNFWHNLQVFEIIMNKLPFERRRYSDGASQAWRTTKLDQRTENKLHFSRLHGGFWFIELPEFLPMMIFPCKERRQIWLHSEQVEVEVIKTQTNQQAVRQKRLLHVDLKRKEVYVALKIFFKILRYVAGIPSKKN